MTDPRVQRLARLIAGYSLDLKPGQLFRIDCSDQGAPLALELYRAALSHGAMPYTNIQLSGLEELLVSEGNDEQLVYVSPIQEREVELVAALVTVWADANTRSFSGTDPERYQRHVG